MAANQNMALLEQLARSYVKGELSQRPQATFRLGKLDRRLAVPACVDPQIAWSDGAEPSGNTFLDIYCLSPGWRLRLPVSISDAAMGLILTRPVRAGDMLGPDDIRQVPLPDSSMARDILADPAQVVGQSMTSGAAAGIWLRSFMVRPPFVVKMNQRVKVVVSGDGFSVEAEGVAIANGRAGDVVPVRMPNGQLLRGVAGQDGVVSLSN
ncbi:flagellar basal body P-ring formation chaperone FlgA [Paludibacterium purpuratum]|uniref:Flagella basal body P-ring formation protein FlgA n=1 Tax=Paludibacterium purpuratum TaxID=1144873 RepID=A0A4R7BCV7_9NEIS|nr:flagellar basal body P-ring formation chaperone FlgA [Paludibacterium purpuratum]TDR81457.1 flagella basal body P-ring formation protein FlgA [Paludibacterium purpuratum]